jgi:hypothetical protein
MLPESIRSMVLILFLNKLVYKYFCTHPFCFCSGWTIVPGSFSTLIIQAVDEFSLWPDILMSLSLNIFDIIFAYDSSHCLRDNAIFTLHGSRHISYDSSQCLRNNAIFTLHGSRHIY